MKYRIHEKQLCTIMYAIFGSSLFIREKKLAKQRAMKIIYILNAARKVRIIAALRRILIDERLLESMRLVMGDGITSKREFVINSLNPLCGTNRSSPPKGLQPLGGKLNKINIASITNK